MSHSSEGTPGPGASRSADLIAGAIVAAVAVAAIVTSRDFPNTGLDTDVGPARFPLIYAGALLILSAILVLGRLLPKRRDRERGAGTATGTGASIRALPVVIGIAATVAYVYLITLLGYVPTTVVFLVGMMWLMGERHRIRTPLIAVAITVVLYLVFLYGLQIPLPDGSLFDSAELL